MPKTTTPFKITQYKSNEKVKKPEKKVKWAVDEPKKQERIALYEKCPKCILVPPKTKKAAEDPKEYKFPICTKLSKSKDKCEINCTGVVAANRRARLTKKYPKVVQLTKELIEKYKCTKKAQAEADKKKTTKKPATKKPVTKKSITKKPTKPVTKKPTKPITKKPTKPKTSKK